ncbi:MAG: gamma-glutamyltransferase [Alphaproteobacteria bacterium]|nr:gamma-glutamyltransferase [Alphaproteobacteria bacterium]
MHYRSRRLTGWLLLAVLSVGGIAFLLADGDRGPSGKNIASRYMVVAAHPLATEAGLEMLREGGTAIDAAIATALVLTLVEPQSSGIGGGGFLVHYAKKTGQVESYDGRETAPAAVDEKLFLDAAGEPLAFYDAAVGGRAVGVPGLIRLFELAHKEHGKLSWKRLFVPAIRHAENGFAISKRLHERIQASPHLDAFEPTARYFLNADGSAKAAGTTLKNPALAKTFRLLAEKGADAFYEGEIAETIARTVATAKRNPGRMTVADIAAYRAIRRDPVCRDYRAMRLCTMGPPTSGGVTLLQILGMLESFDLAALAPNSAAAVHLMAEASRLAFADRDHYLADPDFVPQPVAAMLDAAYLVKRAGLLSPQKSLGRALPGVPGKSPAKPAGDEPEPPSTSHLSVVDGEGNALALTASIENAFGSRLMVGGFLLNNELTDFSFRPVRDGMLIANRVQPGKRPRSSMAPTLVFGPDGEFRLSVGSPGGPYIIAFVLKTLVAVLDWGKGIQAAIDLPNFANRNQSTELEKGTDLHASVPALEALGHEVILRDLTSGLHGIERKEAKLIGGADPRREGVALGD